MNKQSFWIDTHCHLNLPDFVSDLPDVLQRAENANVKKIVIPGIDWETTNSAKEMAEANSAIFFAAGIHPNTETEWDDSIIAQLQGFVHHPKCVAIGEIGLDFYREYCPHVEQQKKLEAQLSLATTINKPVIIHCRQAFDALWEILYPWSLTQSKELGVLHAFDEDCESMKKAADAGFYFGIGGAYTYKNQPRRQAVLERIPLNRILLETDAPYLTPVPYRGKRNEPAYIPLIAKCLCEIRGISLEALVETVFENTLQLFPMIGSSQD